MQHEPASGDAPSAAPPESSSAPGIDGLYIHVPFCFHKCHYCDFYSIVDAEDRQAAFVERIVREAEALASVVAEAAGCGVAPRTVFVGGGTPTLLTPGLWRRMMSGIGEAFDLSRVAEFTVEANPETVTDELAETLASLGVNRMSIGCQSFDAAHLATLERWHEPESVARSVAIARRAGIANLNLDLIFAIPGQPLEDWRLDLDRALDLAPDHLSCYALMYEPNTPLTRKLRLGRLTRCPEEAEAAMFETTIDTLADAGFEHYEVSNFALPGRRCEHNLIYWRNGGWLPLGPGAAGHLNGTRWRNMPHLGRYLASAGPAPIEDLERLDESRRLGERLMLGLRLLEGMPLDWLEPRLDAARRRAIATNVEAGLLERASGRLRLTRRGLLLADTVIAELL